MTGNSETTGDSGSGGAVRVLSAFAQVGEEIEARHTPASIAQQFVDIVEAQLGFQFGAVLEVDERTDRLVPLGLSRQGRDAAFLEADTKYVRSRGPKSGDGVTGWVATTGRAVNIGDVSEDRRYLSMRRDVRSEMCVPLRVCDRVIGVVNVEARSPQAYSGADLRILETLAPPLAASIHARRGWESAKRAGVGLQEHEGRLEPETGGRGGYEKEIGERVRLCLARISGLIDATRIGPTNVAHFADTLSDRVAALATTETLLAQASRTGVELKSLVEAMCSKSGVARVSADGPSVVVGPRQVGPLGFVLHELMGIVALRGVSEGGSIDVEVEWSGARGGNRLEIAWSERGKMKSGSNDAVLERIRLVEGLAASELGGRIQWGFLPGSGNHRLEVDLDRVA